MSKSQILVPYLTDKTSLFLIVFSGVLFHVHFNTFSIFKPFIVRESGTRKALLCQRLK
jgi:hypothetical protein